MPCSITIESTYYEESVEVAYRGGGFEWNTNSNRYFSKRIYSDGFIRVYSGVNREDVENHAKVVIQPVYSTELSVNCDEFYNGGFSVGEPCSDGERIELMKNVISRLINTGLRTETILVSRLMEVEHNVVEYGVHASEKRFIHELYLYLYGVHMGRLISVGELIVSNKLSEVLGKLDDAVDKLFSKVKTLIYAKSFNPINIGKWVVLLSGDSACAFYHEVAHLLESDEPVKLPLNYEFNVDLKVIEDPFTAGPLQRLFDDEVYPAWRRTLIDKGIVVDYLRTRLTSDKEHKPGNARGLFIKPKPMYHQLVVKPGDWSIDEALEEFKKMIVVRDIVKAELYGNYITIYPEDAYIYDKERWMPVRNLLIRIPVHQLNRVIVGLTNEVNVRYSFERNHPVYEAAPSTIIEAQALT